MRRYKETLPINQLGIWCAQSQYGWPCLLCVVAVLRGFLLLLYHFAALAQRFLLSCLLWLLCIDSREAGTSSRSRAPSVLTFEWCLFQATWRNKKTMRTCVGWGRTWVENGSYFKEQWQMRIGRAIPLWLRAVDVLNRLFVKAQVVGASCSQLDFRQSKHVRGWCLGRDRRCLAFSRMLQRSGLVRTDQPGWTNAPPWWERILSRAPGAVPPVGELNWYDIRWTGVMLRLIQWRICMCRDVVVRDREFVTSDGIW